MSRMKLAIAIVAITIGCKQKPADDMGASSGKSRAMGTAGDIGSAMGTKVHDAAPGSVLVDAAPTPKTPDEIAKRYDECIRFANEERGDELRNCYVDAPPYTGVKREPQLVMISGNTIVAILLAGGSLAGNVVETDARGTFLSDVEYLDPKGKPLATKLALISKHDDVERANVAAMTVKGERAWAAGEFVAQIEKTAGKDRLAIYRFANGKIVETWTFTQR